MAKENYIDKIYNIRLLLEITLSSEVAFSLKHVIKKTNGGKTKYV